jgi:hypothetical protein
MEPYWSLLVTLPWVFWNCWQIVATAPRRRRRPRLPYRIEQENVFYLNSKTPNT